MLKLQCFWHLMPDLSASDTALFKEKKMMDRIGFISTRFAGTDGVSLEAAKWAEVLEQEGHRCYWFAGELDRDPSCSHLADEAHFKHPAVNRISEDVFGRTQRDPDTTEMIHTLRACLKKELYSFIRRYDIQRLIVQNALTIPMNIPLGLALAEVISETGIPTIAHHHDFFWERKRFSVNAVGEYLPMAFPADLPNIRHVVINTPAQRDLAHRRGLASTLIPNVLDFDHPHKMAPEEVDRFRRSIGLTPEDLMVLQPTRLIKRKGIEHVIELVKALNEPRCKLVISHEDGDEGLGYSEYLQNLARSNGVDLRLVKHNVTSPWHQNLTDDNQFSLWTVYAAADLVTFCSLYEGFGNGLLEAIYFRKPVVINRYDIFISDIEPLGFEFITMDGYLTPSAVKAARKVLHGINGTRAMQEKNFALARRYFSYEVLRRRLNFLLAELNDIAPQQHPFYQTGPAALPLDTVPMRMAV